MLCRYFKTFQTAQEAVAMCFIKLAKSIELPSGYIRVYSVSFNRLENNGKCASNSCTNVANFNITELQYFSRRDKN